MSHSAGDSMDVFFALLERGEDSVDLRLLWGLMTHAVKGSFKREAVDALFSEFASGVKTFVGSGEVAERMDALNTYFRHHLEFRGNTENYIAPSNTYLDDVVVGRIGIPITLSLVFMELGRAADLIIEPIGFPAHFLVREKTSGILCDPFNGRVGLSREECLEMVSRVYGQPIAWDDDFLSVARKSSILLRMLNNLRNAFMTDSDPARLEITERMIERLTRLEVPREQSLLH